MKNTIFLLTIIFALSAPVFSAEEEAFSQAAFVKEDGANIRAGDNINFETLCALKMGEPVRIIGKRYSWFKIILPREAHLYIKNDYVDLDEEKMEGVVNAQRVNLRAGPDTRYSIMGQVSRPEKVEVLSEKDGWYEISPPEGTAGWIHSSQVTFSEDEAAAAIASSLGDTEKEADVNITMQNEAARSKHEKRAAPKSVRLTLEPQGPKGNLIFSTGTGR